MRLRDSIKACMPMFILEKEREHIGSIWTRITCRALPLSATQSLARRASGDSRSLRLLMVVIGNKQHKQINKQLLKCKITGTKTIIMKKFMVFLHNSEVPAIFGIYGIIFLKKNP
jgi:hypothetical protein